jgi:serine/threonine-protein kinase
MPALMLRIAHEAHPPIRTLRPGLPSGLDGFFDQALAKDPAARYANGASFAQALRDLNTTGRR